MKHTVATCVHLLAAPNGRSLTPSTSARSSRSPTVDRRMERGRGMRRGQGHVTRAGGVRHGQGSAARDARRGGQVGRSRPKRTDAPRASLSKTYPYVGGCGSKQLIKGVYCPILQAKVENGTLTRSKCLCKVNFTLYKSVAVMQ
jgi:hypothetical protein